jgi:hypothetical protein
MSQMKDRAVALMEVLVDDGGSAVGSLFEGVPHGCSADFLRTAREGRGTYQRRLRRP